MASYDLIDHYLVTLRSQLRWRRDAAEIDVELRDHLYSAAERLEDDGVLNEEAQHEVLGRFGESGNVALSFASAGKRGLAVPTGFSRKSGTVALLASFGWLLVVGAFSAAWIFEGPSGEWERRSQVAWMLGSIGLLGSVVATALLIAALDRRHGGLGVIGRIGIGLAGLAAVTSIVSWLFVVALPRSVRRSSSVRRRWFLYLRWPCCKLSRSERLISTATMRSPIGPPWSSAASALL